MHTFPLHTENTAPEGARPGLGRVSRKYGFVPNMFAALAESPAALNGYLALADAFDAGSAFGPAERQLLLLTISAVNGCEYCVPAHTAAARKAGLADDVIEAVRRGTPIPDSRLRALHEFAVKVVTDRGRVSETDIRVFLRAGFTKGQVLEVIVAAALKTISNYTHHVAAVPLDEALSDNAWTPVRRNAAE